MTTALGIQRWPHQLEGRDGVIREIGKGTKSICLTSPTGGGKSLIMADICEWATQQGWRVGVYVNRRLLVQNLAEKFDEYGLQYGVEAAGWEAWQNPDAPVQILSIQTVYHRVMLRRKKTLTPHKLQDFNLVLRDECHIRAYLPVMEEHAAAGAVEVGMTATPLGINTDYDKLIIAGTKRELFNYDPPALIPVHYSAIEEPDLRKIKRDSDGEFIINGKLKKHYTQHIVGNVINEWKKSAFDRPTFGYASGGPEANFLTDECNHAGIPSASILHDKVYVDGEVYKCDQEASDDVFARLKDGNLKIVWSRFKLREGVDHPFVSYGILATPVGSFLSYLQMVGRLMRYHSDLDEVRVQDHGGNWWRHPSPNQDVDWHRFWDLPARAASVTHSRSITEGKTKPGINCPHCGEVMGSLPLDELCRRCKKPIQRGKAVRRVVQEDGTLRDVTSFGERKNVKQKPGSEKMWAGIYWGWSKNKPDKTFGQAWAWFSKKHYDEFRCFPPRDLKFMPKDELDWFRRVGDVPMERLSQ